MVGEILMAKTDLYRIMPAKLKTMQNICVGGILGFFIIGLARLGIFIFSDTRAEFARYSGARTEEEKIKRIPELELVVEILERFPQLRHPDARTLLINPNPRTLGIEAHPFILNYYLLPGKLFFYRYQKRAEPAAPSLDGIPTEWLETERINWILYNYGHPDVRVEPYIGKTEG
ncbi:MAG: hypothetical protein AMS15_01535 [Planctomycetes bacterium DG_23]|nr:MAG: hypothetical protein AMS15_01535 [Planctomycetes bacterium DG_23]